METFLKKVDCPMYPRFKSHYVVWKLNVTNDTYYEIRTFKSHYVVWKLNVTNDTYYEIRTFKSHYVVWKPKTK